MDVDLIIARLKEFFNVRTITELADILGLQQGSVSSWKKRGTIPIHKIIAKHPDLDVAWLMSSPIVDSKKLYQDREASINKIAESDIVYLFGGNNANELLPGLEESIAAGRKAFVGDMDVKEVPLREIIARPGKLMWGTVTGDSMEDAGIIVGDILIVNTEVAIKNNDIVVANYNNEFIVKRYIQLGRRIVLMSDNMSYPPIDVKGNDSVVIIGVVESTIRNFFKRNRTYPNKVRS